MKKLSLFAVLMLIPILSFAQLNSIDRVIDKYSGEEGVTVVNISPDLFKIISDLDVKEVDADIPFDKLSAVKILAIENQELLKGVNFYEEVTKDLNTEKYAEIMSVKDGDEDVRMWLRNEGKQIREFFLLVSSPGEGVIVYIAGNFTMEDIQGLAEEFGGLEGLEELENLEIN